MTAKPNRIDVHHHLIPPTFAEAVKEKGLSEVAGASLPHWTPEASIETMDVHGIATAILSLSTPGTFLTGGSEWEACDLARSCNEYAADLVSRHPGRFGSFAVLPMPFTEQACKEAEYALDVLKADGIVLLGSTDGHFLGDPRFGELMAELDRRAAVVFVHPNLHETSTQLGLQAPGFLVEFLCDTTRAATNLILSGTVERYPRIRWILAHAGGFLPYVAWRLSLANEIPHFALKAPKGVLHYVRSFYYDTALSPSPYAMAALRELVPAEHILFGSDYPFAPAIVTDMQTQALEGLSVLDEATKRGIDRAHALALFPRLASIPQGDDSSLAARVKHALAKPVEALAERIRDR
ncbi:amidohydrolase family protein [Methylobacterium sp. C33D]